MTFENLDRKMLLQTHKLVLEGRRPPVKIGQPLESTWSAIIARGSTVLAKAVFQPGDKEDGVVQAWNTIDDHSRPEELSLYLSLEPNPTYQRIPPVTESIRNMGIPRVLIGTLHPTQSISGKGIQSLEQYGLEVIIADGEEAHLCQLLYEDYKKSINRFLPQIKLIWDLKIDDEKKIVRVSVHNKSTPFFYDILLFDVEAAYREDSIVSLQDWVCVLDPFGAIPMESHLVQNREEKTIVFIGDAPAQEEKRKQMINAGIHVVQIPIKENYMDVAPILRQLRNFGFYLTAIHRGPALWKRCVQSRLVDTIGGFLPPSYKLTKALVTITEYPLAFAEEPTMFQLHNPRLITQTGAGSWIEAEVLTLQPNT